MCVRIHGAPGHSQLSAFNACRVHSRQAADFFDYNRYRMINFWNELPRPFFILAPMEAVTDVVFRHVIAKAGAPEVWFTEFTNATGWYHAGDKAIGGRLIKTDNEHPIVAQLWGSDPVALEALAKHCAELGYDGIDINMGCPEASAVKSGGGAGMILNPENAAAIIAAAKKSGLPVSVKTRLGYSKLDELHDWISHILSQDIVNFTIHLRTKKEMSKVPAHYELIPEIVKLRDEIAPQTLLTINGDIRNRAHGLELVEKYGVDGVMIGRGIFANPFAFAASAERVAGESEQQEGIADNSSPLLNRSDRTRETAQLREPSEGLANDASGVDEEANTKINKRLDLLKLQLDLYDQYSAQTGRPFETLKRFFKIYIRDFAGASELRDQLMHTKSTDEVRSILEIITDPLTQLSD